MKTLHLLRHAKSSWADKSQADHLRSLNKRGERSLVLLARCDFVQQLPEITIYSSPARRTLETIQGVCREAAITPRVHQDEALYTFVMEDLLRWLKQRDDHENNILLVGHNDALYDLACYLTGEALDALPTASYLRLQLDVAHWKDSGAGTAIVKQWVKPVWISYNEFQRRHRLPGKAQSFAGYFQALPELVEPVALGMDCEFLHHYRILLRKMRGVLKQYRKSRLDPQLHAQVRQFLRLNLQLSSPIRDLDVMLQTLPNWQHALQDDRQLMLLQQFLQEKRRGAYAVFRVFLRSDQYCRLLHACEAFAAQEQDNGEGKNWQRKHRHGVGFDQLLQAYRQLQPKSADAEFHRFRILLKHFRYTADDEQMLCRHQHRQLARLQELLGELQDRTVQLTYLQGFLQQSLTEPLRQVCETLVQLLQQQQQELRKTILAGKCFQVDPTSGKTQQKK